MRGGGYEHVLDAFLETNRLYVNKSDARWTVSRIRIQQEGEPGLWSVDAYDATPAQILSKLSSLTKTTITYQQLPAQKISLHLAEVSVGEAVETLLRPWEEYQVDYEGVAIHISRREPIQRTAALPDNREILRITRNGEQYDGQIRRATIQRVIESLFELSGNQYSSLIDGTGMVGELSFSGRSFQRTLELIMEQVNGTALLWDGIWYLLPGGSAREVVADRSKFWERYHLNNTTVANIRTQLETQFIGIQLVEIDRHTLMARLDQEFHGQLASFIQRADTPQGSHPIRLKYIKSEALLKNLPPSVEAQDLVDAGTGDTVFFVGPEGRRKHFMQELEILDRPRQLIRYDLLIMQYQKSSNLSWGVTAAMRPLEAGDRTVISGELGRLLGMNFDAITLFGLLFSLQINAALGSNEASIFADTTLYGNSGEKISFKNTNTYRYREAVVDPDTGKSQYTGITREIVSGLVLDISGWASGDGMITMDVSASVSKQGVNTNSVNPPATTEKVVSTQVRSRSGEPVVLSGLSQRNEEEAAQGVPFLSQIPLLGNLFKEGERSETHTEMIIYLVPHLEEDGRESAPLAIMEAFYSLCGAEKQGTE